MKQIVRLTPTEYELENGDVFPIPFEIDENITIEEFQIMLDQSEQIVSDLVQQVKNGEVTRDKRSRRYSTSDKTNAKELGQGTKTNSD